jgi:hypothetical protein
LKSIFISCSIRELDKKWYGGCSLSTVVFESGALLVTMIESEKVDLEGGFEISVSHWDGEMSFPGYSVSVIPGRDNLIRLVKVKKAPE